MTTPDIDSIPPDQLRTRLKVALEDAASKAERIIELELKVRSLQDNIDSTYPDTAVVTAMVAARDQRIEGEGEGEGEIALANAAPAEPTLQDIAAFIGLAPRYASSTTALMVGLRELRDGPAAHEEGTGTDTLAEAIESNRDERRSLSRDLRQARQIVNQTAAALQVGEWDKDGSEIIERAQRLGIFLHTLQQRMKIVENPAIPTHHDQGDAAERAARRKGASDELRGLLVQFMAPEAIAKIMATRPAFAATPAMFEMATAPTPPGQPIAFLDSFSINQLEWMIEIVCAAPALPGFVSTSERTQCQNMLKALHRSTSAKSDVVAMFRGAVLPILRQQVAKGIIDVEDLQWRTSSKATE